MFQISEVGYQLYILYIATSLGLIRSCKKIKYMYVYMNVNSYDVVWTTYGCDIIYVEKWPNLEMS